MTEIKQGAEASKAADNFTEKGSVKTFISGGAKALSEKAILGLDKGLNKVIDNQGFALGTVFLAVGVATGSPIAAGSGLYMMTPVKYKKALIEKLSLPTEKAGEKAGEKVKNLVKKALSKDR